jgi:hypothetical protein
LDGIVESKSGDSVTMMSRTESVSARGITRKKRASRVKFFSDDGT